MSMKENVCECGARAGEPHRDNCSVWEKELEEANNYDPKYARRIEANRRENLKRFLRDGKNFRLVTMD